MLILSAILELFFHNSYCKFCKIWKRIKQMRGSASAKRHISTITLEMVFDSIKLNPFCSFINIFSTLQMCNFKATVWPSAIFSCYIFVLWETKFILVYSISALTALKHAICGRIIWEWISLCSCECRLILIPPKLQQCQFQIMPSSKSQSDQSQQHMKNL